MCWKAKKPIPKVSSKQAAINRKRSKVYNELDKEWEPGFCQGCGRWVSVIDHSHLISQNDKELTAEKGNIVPHCRDCHPKWELPTQRWKLLDFRENMEYIQRVRPDLFREMLANSEMKIERHYPEELPRFLEAIQGF